MFTAYEDQDVDEDPVIFLPCGHFFTVSTLDGHLSINEVYEETTAGSGEFWSVKPLRAANISEKPMTCPDCRSVIHSVKRYGRLLRLAELRSLERKAIMNVNETLKHISMRMEGSEHFKSESLIKRLKTVEQRLLQSPMRKVYEACRDDHAFEVPRPPTRPLLDTLELLGRAYSGMTEARDDVNFQLAKDAFMRGIALADETTSTRSGATLRLSLCSLIMKWPSLSDALKKEAMQLVGWVVDLQPPLPAELLDRALQMKNSILDPHKDIAEVLKAMNVHSDYNYGGSWSSHWYECPNGHPYFIGECWGAMQESQCIECGAPVGGHDHTLNSTNRRVGGAVAELLHGERRGA